MQGTAQIKAYKGGELDLTEAAMTFKMWAVIGAICFAAQSSVFLFLSILMLGPKTFWLLSKIELHYLLGFLRVAEPFPSSVAGQFMLAKLPAILIAFLLSCSAYALAPLLLRRFRQRAEEALRVEHIRGMQIQTVEELQEATKDKPGFIPLGPVILPTAYEPEHLFIAGKPRVGKTVCLMQVLCAIRAKNSKAVVYDFKGEYVERFYKAGRDHILNPLDVRDCGWNIFNDIHFKHDIVAVVQSLIPPSQAEERFFNTAAADVLRGMLYYLYQVGKRTNADLWALVTSSTETIYEACKATEGGQAGAAYIQDASSKQALGVVSTVMSYLSWLEFAQDDGGFSIREWLDEPGGGFVFLTGRPEVENTIRPMTGLFVDLMGKIFLSLPEDRERRVYFMLDEFGNMQQLPTIKRLLTAGGSKGAIVIIGIQDVAALQKIYGREDATTIFNSCGTTLVLNVADPDTAKFLSRRFGEAQWWDTNENHSMGVEDGRDGLTISRQKRIEALVLDSEIMSLPKLKGYLKIPEQNPVLIMLEIKEANNLPVLNQAFELKEGLSFEDIVLKEFDTYAAQQLPQFQITPVQRCATEMESCHEI